MPVIVSMLRGVNLAAHNRMKMDALRAVYAQLDLRDAQSFIQSGNVVFRTSERSLPKLATRIEEAIERKFGFRPPVILRTTKQMRETVASNPFADRPDIDPAKLLVWFLAGPLSAEAVAAVRAIKADPEEMHLAGNELFVYYANGMARPKLSWPVVERAMKVSGTGRNWNSVQKLLEMAEALETAT
jgi:uncharacterized protein (DUF1697 family)